MAASLLILVTCILYSETFNRSLALTRSQDERLQTFGEPLHHIASHSQSASPIFSLLLTTLCLQDCSPSIVSRTLLTHYPASLIQIGHAHRFSKRTFVILDKRLFSLHLVSSRRTEHRLLAGRCAPREVGVLGYGYLSLHIGGRPYYIVPQRCIHGVLSRC
jgi:hypothetical protein